MQGGVKGEGRAGAWCRAGSEAGLAVGGSAGLGGGFGAAVGCYRAGGAGTEGLEELDAAGNPGSGVLLQLRVVCVGEERHLRAVGGVLDCGGLVWVLRGKGCPVPGLVAALSSGLWLSPEREMAVVGISREAGAVRVRVGIEG